MGYFCVDSVDSSPGKLVLNRTATLRDPYAKMQKAEEHKKEQKKS